MDTSEEYIKMCEAAVEIQDNHKWLIGDWFVYIHSEQGEGTFLHFTTEVLVEAKERVVIGLGEKNMPSLCEAKGTTHQWDIRDVKWLPRQDQLQAMCKHTDDVYALVELFAKCVNSGELYLIGNQGKCFTSMEQLWLAFVMKEKYDKVWDGDKWQG